MTELNDCYILAPSRSAVLASAFLEHFVPHRRAAFDVSDPSEVLSLPADVSLDRVLRYLEATPAASYSLYFHNLKECDPLHAAAMFNGDGSLFLMLSVSAIGGEESAALWLRRLQEMSGAELGYWGWEEAPVLDALEFAARAGPAA